MLFASFPPTLRTVLNLVAKLPVSGLPLIRRKIVLKINTSFLLSNYLILGLVDLKKQSIKGIVIGDGLVKIDEKVYDFDQDNKPDYLGLHLLEDFEEWYSYQSQVIDSQIFNEIVISTDGIFSFLPFEYRELEKTIDSDEFILKKSKLNFKQKMLCLEEDYGLKPTDDLAIISIKFP